MAAAKAQPGSTSARGWPLRERRHVASSVYSPAAHQDLRSPQSMRASARVTLCSHTSTTSTWSHCPNESGSRAVQDASQHRARVQLKLARLLNRRLPLCMLTGLLICRLTTLIPAQQRHGLQQEDPQGRGLPRCREGGREPPQPSVWRRRARPPQVSMARPRCLALLRSHFCRCRCQHDRVTPGIAFRRRPRQWAPAVDCSLCIYSCRLAVVTRLVQKLCLPTGHARWPALATSASPAPAVRSPVLRHREQLCLD